MPKAWHPRQGFSSIARQCNKFDDAVRSGAKQLKPPSRARKRGTPRLDLVRARLAGALERLARASGWRAVGLIAGGVVAMLGLAMALGQSLDGTPGWQTWLWRGALIVVLLGIGAALAAILTARLLRHDARTGPILGKDHVLVLGWNDTGKALVCDLLASGPGRALVVIAPPEAAADAEIGKLSALEQGRVLLRHGTPDDPALLARFGAAQAAGAVLLAPRGEAADAAVLGGALALGQVNARLRMAAQAAGPGATATLSGLDADLRVVEGEDLLARVLAHELAYPGMAQLHRRLLAGRGLGMHLLAQPQLAGNSFGDAMMAFETATLIGLCDEMGRIGLALPPDLVIAPQMRAVFLAARPQDIAIATGNIAVDQMVMRAPIPRHRPAQTVLVLGWHARVPRLVAEFSRHVAPDSVLTLAADAPGLDEAIAALTVYGDNLRVEYGHVDITDRQVLAELDLARFDRVLVLAQGGPDGDRQALQTLTMVSQIARERRLAMPVLAGFAGRDRLDLAMGAGLCDSGVDDTLVATMLAAQLRDQGEMRVASQMLARQGVDIAFKPIEHYVAIEAPLNFYTLVDAARQRGEVAIGIKRRGGGRPEAGQLLLNPRKTQQLEFIPGDQIVVLTQDQDWQV